jgi:hypothetical protein
LVLVKSTECEVWHTWQSKWHSKWKWSYSGRPRNSSEQILFKCAPVTSCDVERSFPRFKTILSDTRRYIGYYDGLDM